jgi:hypothetical protein
MALSVKHQNWSTPYLQVLYNFSQLGSTLEIAKKIESTILEDPPCLVSLKPNLSCQLFAHGHGHSQTAKEILRTRPDC